MILGSSGPRLATCALRPGRDVRPARQVPPRDHHRHGAQGSLPPPGRRVGAVQPRLLGERGARAHPCRAPPGGPDPCAAGQAYFICDHFPADNLFDFMERSSAALGLPVPAPIDSLSAGILAGRHCGNGCARSNFNRFAVVQTCVDHTFVHGKGRARPGVPPDRLARRGVPTQPCVAAHLGLR